MDRLDFALEIKSIDEKGVFSGFASVYNVRDLGGDIVSPGAFQKTLQSRGAEVPILFSHDSHRPVGLGRLEDSAKGLMIHGRLSMGIQDAQDVYTLMRDGVLKGLSIGYSTVRDDFKDGVRYLRELKLFEVSLVTFPMNEAATVTAVKASDHASVIELKTFIQQHDSKMKRIYEQWSKR